MVHRKNHLYIVWNIYEEPRRSDGGYSLAARCTACHRVVGSKDVGYTDPYIRSVYNQREICPWQGTKVGIESIKELAKQEFGQDKFNATKEETD